MYVDARADQSPVPWEPPAFAVGPLKSQWPKYWGLVQKTYGGVTLTHSTDDLFTSLIAFLSWWAKEEYEHAVDKAKRMTKLDAIHSHDGIVEFLEFLNDEEKVKVPRSLAGEGPGTTPRPLPGSSHVLM
jgi:hypothetical protein